MKEICKLVTEKGFEPKTLSTNDTFKHYILGGLGRLNEISNYLILCEIQKWIRDEFSIDVISYPSANINNKYIYLIISNLDLIKESDEKYDNYGEALKAGIKETLKTI